VWGAETAFSRLYVIRRNRHAGLLVSGLLLARVATFPDAIFEVLRSKPKLVASEETGVKEAAKDTVIPKRRKRGV
jgi:hypothetical protein